MSNDDFSVILFKMLSYMYACLKAGVEPNMDIAREKCGCNELYWSAVVDSALDNGYIAGDVFRDMNGTIVEFTGMRVTFDGVEFIGTNSTMRKVREFMGAALPTFVEGAIKATALI